MSEPEVAVVRLRRHARVLILPALILLGTAFASGYFIGSFPDAWQNWLAVAIALLLVIGGVLLPLSIWLGNTITVTTRRVIVRRGLFTRTRSEVSLGRVREIRSRASIFQRPFKSGTVQLITGLDEPIEMVDVPSVSGVVDMLHELVDQAFATGVVSHSLDGAERIGDTGVTGAAGTVNPNATMVLTEAHDDLEKGF